MDDTGTNDAILILTLGDGDFTYSLDLARFLGGRTEASIHLVATGFDSKDEVLSKYRDSPHILDQLACAKSPKLSISIKHEINAILAAGNHYDVQGAKIGEVDHVIFNHPHLGTENAILHGRFLCHFFDACVHGWLNPNKGGLIHLTLVDGQYERWNCVQAAKSQGLVLLQRAPFTPPPVDSPSYRYRRHQSGKSFESRRPNGSETFVFAREKDRNIDLSSCILSWRMRRSHVPPTQTDGAYGPRPSLLQALSCPHCDRVFKEERSRQCHIRDKHPNGSDKSVKTESARFFQCELCNPEGIDARKFDSKQGLQDHFRSKHSAIYKTIHPDWCQGVKSQSKLEATHRDEFYNASSKCGICGAPLASKENEFTHLDDFRPCSSDDKFRCQFCGKSFREMRAKLQHENFCNQRQLGLFL